MSATDEQHPVILRNQHPKDPLGLFPGAAVSCSHLLPRSIHRVFGSEGDDLFFRFLPGCVVLPPGQVIHLIQHPSFFSVRSLISHENNLILDFFPVSASKLYKSDCPIIKTSTIRFQKFTICFLKNGTDFSSFSKLVRPIFALQTSAKAYCPTPNGLIVPVLQTITPTG